MNCVNYIESQLSNEDEESMTKTSSSTSISSNNNIENKENNNQNTFVRRKDSHYKINKLNTTIIKKNELNSQSRQSRIPSFYCKTKSKLVTRNKST